jgi:hypothetical protein
MKKIIFAAALAIVLAIALAIIMYGRVSNTIEQCPNREQLEAKISKAKKSVQKFRKGHVIVGRVVLDGAGDVRDVICSIRFTIKRYEGRFGRCWYHPYETIK